jgi:hypothetical protein
MSRPFVGDFEVLGAMWTGDFHGGSEWNGNFFRVGHGRITAARLESQETIRFGARLLARGGYGDRGTGVAHLDIDPIGVRRTDVAAGFDESDEVEALANEAGEFAFARADEGKYAFMVLHVSKVST